MKTIFSSTIRLTLTTLMLALCTNAFSQRTVTWEGGTPGHENEWNYAKNWSNDAVPDAFSNVIISDVSTSSLSCPIIKKGKAEVNSLFIEPSAFLTIEKVAQLIVFEDAEGISPSNLKVNGAIILVKEEKAREARPTTALLND